MLQSQLPLEPGLDTVAPHTGAVLALLGPSPQWDELRHPDGGLRPAWEAFFSQQPAAFWQPEGFTQRSQAIQTQVAENGICLLYTSPSPRDRQKSRMPSSA